MLLHAAMNRYGGFSKYHDLGYIIAPDAQHSSGVEVQMARYEQLYCQEMYGDEGGDGTLFEYELVYPLTETVGNNPEGLKIPQEGGGVQGLSVSDYLGEDHEKYRWHFLIKNNREQDNYAPIIRMTQVLGRSGAAFERRGGSDTSMSRNGCGPSPSDQPSASRTTGSATQPTTPCSTIARPTTRCCSSCTIWTTTTVPCR